MQVFENATIYFSGEFYGNINQIDCKRVTVEPCKYAQYDNAFRIMYLQKGKRRERGFYVYGLKFCMVVPTKEAVKPDSMYGPEIREGGMIRREAKYSAFDPRWESEFLAKIEGATVLFKHEAKQFNYG